MSKDDKVWFTIIRKVPARRLQTSELSLQHNEKNEADYPFKLNRINLESIFFLFLYF